MNEEKETTLGKGELQKVLEMPRIPVVQDISEGE